MAFFDASISELFIGTTDYKSYATDITGIPSQRTVSDVTTIGDTGRKHHPSVQTATPSISAIYEDGTLDPALATLRTATSGQTLTYWPGGDATSDRGWGIGSVYSTGVSNQSQIGEAVKVTLGLQSDNVMEPIHGLQNSGKQTSTASGSGSAVDDNGASSSAGGAFYYHVFAISATGGNAQWTFNLQDDDNSGFTSPATVATVTIGDSAIGAARISFTGTFQRYVRIQRVLDASSGSVTFVTGFNRGV